ncbi:MAG TPA: hypothetical protein DIW48_11375 [Sphaerochaeta sp.]|nr:hypothetical protein [Sphaerochaeta sp.]
MNKKIAIIVLAALLCCIATQVSAGVSGAKTLRWYLEVGGGTVGIEGDLLPTGSLHTGIQLGPSVAVGAYSTLTLLSDFEHAEFGLSTADVEAAFSLATGTELTFTPYSEWRFHPLVRLSVGGITAGYLENTDNEEGYETAHVQRFFHAAAHIGGELTVTRAFRVTMQGGWSFAGNTGTMGIGVGELGGFEVAIATRILWDTMW